MTYEEMVGCQFACQANSGDVIYTWEPASPGSLRTLIRPGYRGPLPAPQSLQWRRAQEYEYHFPDGRTVIV
jgi:hypothetical protein